jgi:hypothetical protein
MDYIQLYFKKGEFNMKSKTLNKKLSFRRTTISNLNLNASTMENVHAGGSYTCTLPCTYTCVTVCLHNTCDYECMSVNPDLCPE